jgi:hypothetical protein
MVGGKIVREARDGLIFPERSALDVAYVDQLLASKLVDADFVADVLSTDFTRPVFSPTRCDLLDFAPSFLELRPPQITPNAIRQEFIAKLEVKANKSPAEASFLAKLRNRDGANAPKAPIKKFLAACRARSKSDPEGFARDVLTYASHLRTAMRQGTKLVEFPETMPVTKIPDSGNKKLDPETCVLE